MFAAISLLLSSIPLLLTASVSATWVYKYGYPLLLSDASSQSESSSSKKRSRITATVGVVLSVLIMELVLAEVCGWFDPATTLSWWKMIMPVTLAFIVVVVPALQLHMLFSTLLASQLTVGLITTFYLVSWLFLFYKLGAQLPLHGDERVLNLFNSDWSNFSRSLLQEVSGRVAFIGVSAIAVLSGFGAVSSPYNAFLAKSKYVSPAVISRTEAAIDHVSVLLAEKTPQVAITTSQSSTSIVSRFMDSMRNGKNEQETEIEMLGKVKQDLEKELAELQETARLNSIAETTYGKMWNMANLVFSLYCVYRLFNVVVINNPYFRRANLASFLNFSTPQSVHVTETDALAITLAHMFSYVYSKTDIESITRQVSFFLTACLLLGSFSAAYRTINTFKKAFPWLPSHLTNPHVFVLFLVQVLGTYVIATTVMIRSNLPNEMSSAISTALGAPLDVGFVETWFDSLFLLVCILTAAALIFVSSERDLDDGDVIMESKFV
ncbi:Golgi pH regulator-like protein [Yarrowia sp. B02]|nr:Golgi pH regulator-like protein [Yarrowia sp. B02]